MQVQHRQLESMGTRLDMVFPGMEAEVCETLLKQLKSELDRIEGLLSIYRTDSEMSLLNSTAHEGTIKLSQEMLELMLLAWQYHQDTQGYFDISMKAAGDFWKENRGEAQEVPAGIRERVGMHRLIFEKEGIRFKNKGLSIDPGGFGKGHAIKCLLPILEAAGVRSALISFGESLIFGLGSHPYGDVWKVSIPLADQHNPLVFDLKDEALSTSGNSLNNQKKFADSGHIVNPVTLQMATLKGLVSVKAKDPLRAEVFSTALFSAGPDRSKEILKNVPGIESKWVITDN